MSLKAPRLDDRTFADLVEEARARIPLYTPEWTDHHASDPGITLIELFAYMTDIMLYRLNRVPDKHYVKFMELIGMRLNESVPAKALVTFWLSAPQPQPLVIPSDTEVATTRTETDEAIVFATDGEAIIEVPRLAYVMTHFAQEQNRVYRTQNLSGVMAGYESFPVFASETPSQDDALYIGFEQDLSYHLLGFDMLVRAAEGAGINPNNPPYLWEALDPHTPNRWIPLAVDRDTTKGMNTNGMMRVHLPEMVRSVRNDINAYWVRLRLDIENAPDARYESSPVIQQLNVAGWGITVSATNVSRVRNEVLGRSDGAPGQVFYLANTPVAARTTEEYMVVRLEDGREQRWVEVTDFSTSNPNDRHYTLDSDTGEIRLAPALPQPDGSVRRYGALPPKNAMLVMRSYRHGGGVKGNVGIGSINVLKTPIPYIERVLNRFSANGGQDAELLENAKLRVPGHLRSLQRAVTAADFEYLTMQALPGEVGRAYCLQPPLTQRGENKVLVIPFVPVLKGFISPESLELSSDVRDTLQAYLDERRLLSTRLSVTTPVYQWIETEVQINVAQHYDFERVRRAVEDKLFEFINPLKGGMEGKGWQFGRDLVVSDVMAALSNVEGVNFIRQVKLFPVVYENRQFRRLAEVTEIPVPSDGVVVSYQHTILPS